MKCPICEEKIDNTMLKCPNCGFADLRTEFINENELEMWRTYVVYPCKFAYQTSIAQTKDLERKFKKELSAIKKAQKEVQESESTSGGEAPSFKKIVLDKNDGWFTTRNIAYKGFYKCNRGNVSKCEISNLVLTIVGNRVTVDFFVKKIYDWQGNEATTHTSFKWKLKDDYGIVVADGSWYNANLNVGDETKGSISIKGIDPSIQYVLELVND